MAIGNPQLAELLKKQLEEEKLVPKEVNSTTENNTGAANNKNKENTVEVVATTTEEEVNEQQIEAVETTSIELPSLKKQENRKPYPFTLKPSVRKKITKLAKENGYRSASAFVNDIFEGL